MRILAPILFALSLSSSANEGKISVELSPFIGSATVRCFDNNDSHLGSSSTTIEPGNSFGCSGAKYMRVEHRNASNSIVSTERYYRPSGTNTDTNTYFNCSSSEKLEVYAPSYLEEYSGGVDGPWGECVALPDNTPSN